VFEEIMGKMRIELEILFKESHYHKQIVLCDVLKNPRLFWD